MGETENPVNSGVSDPTKSETTPEGGNGSEETPGEKEEVILEDDDLDETDSEEEVVTEETSAEVQEEQETVTEETDETIPDVTEANSKLDSLEEASTAVESVILAKGVKTIQENDTTKKELADLEHAKIVYTDSCASADGTQVRKDTPVTFRVLADKGYKVAAVKFASAAKTDDKSAVDALNELTESQVTNSVSPSDDGIYTVAASNLADGKSILISVELAETEFKIVADGNGTTVEMLKKDGKLAALENVKYTAAGSVVLAVSEQTAGFNYTVTAKTPNGKPKTLTGTHVDAVTGENPVKEYWRYPLNILELDDVDGYADQQTITVTVTSTAAASVKASAATFTKGWNGLVAAASVKADKTDYAPYSVASSYALGKKVAFTVTDDTNESWDAVKKTQISAKLVKDSDEKSLTVTDMPADDLQAAPAEGTKAYFVTLPATLDDGYTLKIDVAAEMVDTVKKITVNAESDAQKVLTVTGGSTEEEATGANADKVTFGSTIKTDGDSYFLNIDSKEGYRLDKVMVKVEGAYTDDTVTPKVTTYEYDLIKDEDTPVYTTNKEIKLLYTGTPGAATPDSNEWKADKVTVTISVKEIEGAEEDKTVTIKSASAAGKVPYTFTVADGENENGKITPKSEYEADARVKVYDITEGTKTLSFTVKAKTTPSVTIDGVAESDNKDLVREQSGDQWTYTIPAKVLKTDAEITITRGERKVTLNKGTSKAAVKWTYQNAKDEDTNLKNQPLGSSVNVDVDEELKINVDKVTGIGNAPIGTVTYKVGDGAETPVTPDSDGNYEFVVTASENIAITVTSVADARLFVENEAMEDDDDGIKELKNGDKVVVGYEKPTTAYLRNGKDQKMKLLNATVTENGKLAQTKAVIQENGTDAVIENVAKSEQGAELEVTLMTADRATMSFTLVSDKAVDDDSEIKFTDEEGNPVKNISLNADTTQTVYVNAASGTISKLAWAVINTPAEGAELPADAKSEKEDAKFTVYLSTTGKLTITAGPESDAIPNAGTIVLYERNDTDKKIIKGSDLKVSIGAPIMKGRASKISVEAGKVTLRNIPVTVAVEDEVRGERDILSGRKSNRIGYQFKVSYTEPAAKPDDYNGTPEEWETFKGSVTSYLAEYKVGKFVDVSDIGEGHEIEICARDVKAYPLTDLKVQARAVQFNASDELIANGDWCTEVPVTIPKPFYSDTLKLGKGESAVATGQDRDVVVATPEFNTKENERYKYVEVEIINKKTGLAHACKDDFRCGYNTLTGEVLVNAANASYSNNAYGYYADLAVKVTAFTENGDYGVSGVKALKVENGLQNITVNMQADILKDSTLSKPAKVTVKPVVTLNNETANKKYQPAAKYKKVTYDIVGSDSYDSNESYEGSPLSKAMQEAVDSGDISIDAKGTITLAKDFIPKDGVEYKFKVLVKADDPLNNKEVQNVSNEVAIINKPMDTGVVGIFEKQYKNYEYQYKLITSGVNSGTVELPVTQTEGQYRLAMIRPGITRTGDIYKETDLVESKYLLLSSSNKKNVEVDEEDGDITVNKLGKVNFTVKVESNSKKQTETVKNINFTMENTPLYVKLTKYQDAGFNVVLPEETQTYPVVGGKTEKFVTSGNETGYYTVELVKMVDDEAVGFTLPNYSYSYKKAKDVTATKYSNKDTVNLLKSQGKAYVLVSGSGTGKNAPAITVTNKQARPAAKMEIQIENSTAATGAAPKLALKDKKQKVYADNILNTVDVTVTTGNKKGLEMPDDAYIMLTADWTKKVKNSYNNVFRGELDKVIPVHRTGTYMGEFSIDMRSDVAESYTLIASLGTMDNGVFTQTYKDARITLKTTKVNTSLKVNPASFTLNPYGVSKRVMTVKSGNDRYKFEDAIPTKVGTDAQGDMFVNNYAKNQIQANGEPNAFNQYFIVTDQRIEKDENGLYVQDDYNDNFYIMINPGLTDKQLDNLASADFMKKNGTGYVTVSNYYGNNKYGVKIDQKITVKVDGAEKLKLTAAADPVLTGMAGTVTDIYVKNGKEAVALEDYSIVDNADFEKYYNSDTMKDVVVEEREDGTKVTEKDLEEERLAKGIIRVKTKTADIAVGKKDVTINVLPADTVDWLRAKVDNKDWLARGTGKSLGVKISVEKKDASQKINVDKNNKTWVVKSQDWVDEGTGWATQIEYSFKNRLNVANGQKIKFASETDYVYFGQDLSETEHNMEKYNTNDVQRVCIYLDKEDLKKAIAKEPKKINWGKKIKVQVGLTFPGEGADAKDLPIKTDKLSIDIILPAEPGFDDAAGLSSAINENEAMLQKFVESRTQFYLNQDKYNNNNYWKKHMSDLAMVVEGELRDKVLGLSQGTTAVIEAKDEQGKWDSTNNMFTFPLKVDKDSWTFYVYYGATGVNTGNAQTIAEKARTYGVDKLNLQFYPEFTTSADLTSQLTALLKKDNALPNNVVLTAAVSTDEYETYAPTAGNPGESGLLTATITVVNKNCTPSNSSSYIYTASKSYEFTALKELAPYTTAAGASSLKNKLEAPETAGAYKDASKMTAIFGAAYTKEEYIDDDNEVQDDMLTGIQNAIEEYAKELAEESENPYLEVTGVSGLACTYGATAADNAEGWSVKFKIAYADHTPQSQTPAPSYEITLPVKRADVKSIVQTADEVQAAAESLFEEDNYLIHAETELAATDAVKAMIKEACVGYADKAKIDVKRAENQQFTAPTDEVNGKLELTVKYSDSISKAYTFILVKKLTDGELPDLNERAKAVDLVKATMTEEKVNEMVVKAWNAFWKDRSTAADATFDNENTTLTNTVMKADLEAVLSAGLGDLKTVSVDSVAVAKVDADTAISIPANSNATGKIGEITITLTDTVADPAWDAEEKTITVKPVTLTKNDCFQAEADYKTKVEKALKETGIAYDGDWFDENGNLKKTDGEVNAEVKTGIATAITDTLSDALTDEAIALNPQWTKKYASGVTAEPQADSAYTNTTVSNVLFKWTADADGTPIVVKIRGLADMDWIRKVNIVSATEKGTSTVAKVENGALTIANATTDKTFTLKADVFGPASATEQITKEIEWKIMDAAGENEVTDRGIEIRNENELFISKDAALADGETNVTNLTLMATAKGDPETDEDTDNSTPASNVATVNLKITLTEHVDGVVLKVDDAVVPDNAVYVAPATDDAAGNKTVTFTAAAFGTHLKDATKSDVVITSTLPEAGDSEKLIFTANTLTMKPGAEDADVTLTFENAAGDALGTPNTKSIQVKGNAGVQEAVALGLKDVENEAKFDKATTGANAKPAKLVISNQEAKPVYVPINLENGAGLEWTYGVEQDTTGNAAAIDNFATLVTCETRNGKLKGDWLKISNDLPEVFAKQDANAEKQQEEIKPTVVTLTATGTGAGAKVVKTLSFELVVNKNITDVKIQASNDNADSVDDVDGSRHEVSLSGEASVYLKAVVTGAHVSATGDDQNVTWSIVSKAKGSKAYLGPKKNSATTVLTIPADSPDNIIKIKAVSKADKSDKPASAVITIKVNRPNNG